MATTKCGNQFNHADEVNCVRNEGHLGLHRNTVRIRPFETTQWGDNEGTSKGK